MFTATINHIYSYMCTYTKYTEFTNALYDVSAKFTLVNELPSAYIFDAHASTHIFIRTPHIMFKHILHNMWLVFLDLYSALYIYTKYGAMMMALV